MASLLDLGPLTEEVEIRGIKLTIQGLTAAHLFQTVRGVPRHAAGDRADRQRRRRDDVGTGPDLFAKVIATATGRQVTRRSRRRPGTMGAARSAGDLVGGAAAVDARRVLALSSNS